MRSSLSPHRYKYIRSPSLARSLLWCTLVIGFKSKEGEYDHVSKCWTIITKGRSRCPSQLYQVNTYIYSIILILQWLLLYSVLQLDSVLRTGLLISKGELQSFLPYLIFMFLYLDNIKTLVMRGDTSWAPWSCLWSRERNTQYKVFLIHYQGPPIAQIVNPGMKKNR